MRILIFQTRFSLPTFACQRGILRYIFRGFPLFRYVQSAQIKSPSRRKMNFPRSMLVVSLFVLLNTLGANSQSSGRCAQELDDTADVQAKVGSFKPQCTDKGEFHEAPPSPFPQFEHSKRSGIFRSLPTHPTTRIQRLFLVRESRVRCQDRTHRSGAWTRRTRLSW